MSCSVRLKRRRYYGLERSASGEAIAPPARRFARQRVCFLTKRGASAAGSALGVTSLSGCLSAARHLRAGMDRVTNLSQVALLYTLRRTGVKSGSRQQIVHHMPVHVRQTEVPALEAVGQTCMVDAEKL